MKISKTDQRQKVLQSLERRLRLSNCSEQTICNYIRYVKGPLKHKSTSLKLKRQT